MCGRFTLTKAPDLITQHFALTAAPGRDHAPRYNIAPSQAVYVIRQMREGRELAAVEWGLLPAWSRDAKGARPINARAETLSAKPTFRDAFRKRRCLIPADGFYEWADTPLLTLDAPAGRLESGLRLPAVDGLTAGGIPKLPRTGTKRKQPWYITMQDHSLFAFGGLWEQWVGAETTIESCTIVTTTPNELMAPVHNRMPLIVAPEDYTAWLSPETAAAAELMRPWPAAAMRMVAVSTLVNAPANDSAGCCEPLTATEAG